MMNSRLGWLLLGCLIGFILGYFARSLREIKDKVDQVDQHMMEKDPHDEGFIRLEWMKNVAVLLVVLLTAYSAFASQKNSNDVQSQQDQSDKIVACNQDFLSKTITALNARTTYTQSQNAANVELQKAFSNLVTLSLKIPPLSDADARSVVEDLSAALTNFLNFSAKSAQKVEDNPYPTKTEFMACVHKKK